LLKAEVSGPYLPTPWLAFMRGLAAEGPAMVVDKVDVSDASAAQFTVTLLVPVKLDQAPAALEPDMPGATADAPAAGPAA
jgi:hypothetical protein